MTSWGVVSCEVVGLLYHYQHCDLVKCVLCVQYKKKKHSRQISVMGRAVLELL